MPVHNWTLVEIGIFHHFLHSWIEEIKRTLNNALLSDEYYALVEQHSQKIGSSLSGQGAADSMEGGMQSQIAAETDMEFYRRKQNTITVRHVSGDRIVAMVELVSPSNKESRNPFRAFVEKAAALLDKGIHLLILDLHPPGKRDPYGIHAAIWEEITGKEDNTPLEKPLTLAAYEAATATRAYVELVAVGEALPDMPLFLEPGAHVLVPLEATYQAAFAALPRRWRKVLEP